MFAIADGREQFYQWDVNRSVRVSDSSITEVHFCNKTDDCSLVVEVYPNPTDSELYANVPNILLQNDFPIRVYAYCGDGYTKVEKIFKVISRTKPSDYAYTETEIKSYEYLDKKLTEIEEKGFSEETVKEAVEEYFIENPTNVSDDGEGNVTIHIVEGELDLSDYAKKEYVDDAVNAIPEPDLSEYAKKSDIPDVSGFISEIPSEYITETELEQKGYLTEHQSLENYATNESVRDSIKSVEQKIPSLSGYATEQWVTNKRYLTSVPSQYVTEGELNAKGYLTQHQDISGKADKEHKHSMSDITDYVAPTIPSLDGYATEDYVNGAIANIPTGNCKVFYLDTIQSSFDKQVVEDAHTIEFCEYVANNYPLECVVYINDRAFDNKFLPYHISRTNNATVSGFYLIRNYCAFDDIDNSQCSFTLHFVKDNNEWTYQVVESSYKEFTIATREYVRGLFADIKTAEGSSY